MANSVGLIESKGLVALIEAADVILKNSPAKILGIHKLDNGLVSLAISGNSDYVKAAVEAGTEAGKRVGEIYSSAVIDNPTKELIKLFRDLFPDEVVVNEVVKEIVIEKVDEQINLKTDTSELTELLKPTIKFESKREKSKPILVTQVKPVIKIKKPNTKQKDKPELKISFPSDTVETKSEPENIIEIKNDKSLSTIERLRQEALGLADKKTQVKESEVSTKKKVENIESKKIEIANSDVDIDAIKSMNVHKLRNYARQFPAFPIKGREISRANREELVELFKSISKKWFWFLKSKISIIVFSVLFSIIIWGSVTLSNEFFSTSSFDVNIINQPNGYASGKSNPQTVFVKLKAKGWQLISLSVGSKVNFNVSADNDSGKISVDPYNEIDENNWVSSGINILEINPREISFVVEKIKYKKLKVVPNAELSFSDGYGLATPINIYPDSVLVAGPTSILDTLKSIKNIRVKLTSADSKTSIITEVETLPGFTVDRNKVQLTFDVQRIVEKSFEGIKVVITDIPKDRDIVLIPNIIECNLRGGINILGKINSNQLYASISYSDIVYDTLGSIQPKVIIPNNTKRVYIKPERLNYIIKKFEWLENRINSESNPNLILKKIMLITFEGIDFCGKSTQVELLKTYLLEQNKNVHLIREPGGTELSEKVREILLDKKNNSMVMETEIFLFSASRAQLVREVIRPYLEKGFYVISDRFHDSSTAYQGYGRGLPVDVIMSINSLAIGETIPDITFFIDIPIEVSARRKSKKTHDDLDRIEISDNSFFERVRNGYLQIAKSEKRYRVLDGTQSIDIVSNQIRNEIKKFESDK